MDFSNDIGESLDYQANGGKAEAYRDEDTGAFKLRPQQVRVGDTGMDLQPPLRRPMRQAEAQTLDETIDDIIPTAVGLAGGATAATLGTLQDIAGFIYGAGKAMTAEEGQRMETFLNTAQEVSDKYGSGAVRGFIIDQAQEAGLDEGQMQVLDEAITVGEFGGIGGLVKGAVTKAPQVLSGAGDIIESAGDAAKARMAEGGATLTSGVNPDPAIAAVGSAVKAMRKKNVGFTDNPISIDLPEIDPDFLVGKKIFPIQADLTKAGGSFTGIDSSKIDAIPLQGGPDFPLLQTSADGKVVWAVDAKGMSSKKLNKDAEYAIVVAMSPKAHQTNATVVKSLTDNLLAYVADGRIDPADVAVIDDKIRQPSSDPTLKNMPNFPGLNSPSAAEWMRNASFDERKRIATVISQPGVQDLGAPNVQRILDETSEGAYTGYNLNDSIMVIKIDKEAGMVELGKEPGTTKHHSYQYGLKGEPVGRLSMVNVENLFPDWFKKMGPIWEQKQKAYEAGETKLPPNPRRSFQMNLPVETITQKKADKIKRVKVQSIKSPLQAKLTMDMMDGNWSTSDDFLTAGGTNALEWVKEARASKEGITLSIPKDDKTGARLTDKEAAAKISKDIKSGDLKLYKLGKNSRTFFGLHKNYNYDEVYEGWTPTPGGPEIGNDEIALVSVLSNDRAANGIGKATVLKAIEEGATVLDCFEVKSGKYPDGFLTTFYGMFDFVEAGRVKFDPQYYTSQELADLEKVWSDRGWKQGDPYPDVVIMKYTGDENARPNATKRFVTEGGFGSGANQAGGTFGSSASNVRGATDQAVGEGAVPSGSDTGRRADRDIRAGGQRATTDRLASVAQEILSLSDEQIQNLGLDAKTLARLRAQYQSGGN